MELKWEKLAAELQAQLDQVKSKISQYPGPIAGCDAQFNHLLEQRYALAGELARLKKVYDRALQDDEGQAILNNFIVNSPYLSDH